MKNALWILLPLSLAVTSPGQAGPRPPAADPQRKEYNDFTAAERGAHQTRWERVTWSTNRLGEAEPRTNAFVELSTGLNFFDAATSQWLPSREEWQVYPDVIVAQAGGPKVILARNLNLGGSVDVLTPEGLRLISNPVGLGFYDPVDGKHLLLAEIKDCAPQWGAATNEIVFRDCFEGIRGSIRYLYTRAGLHQHVVLEQRLRLPDNFSDRSRLECYTEFASDTPLPRITSRLLRREKDPLLRAQMVEPDFTDSELDFGEMAMGAGTAFTLGDTAEGQAIRVGKRFEMIDGRPVLTEAVEFKQLEPLLARLAAVERPKSGLFAVNASRQIKHATKAARLPHEHFRALEKEQEMKLVSNPLPESAVVIDYELLSSATNVTLKGDTLYYVSGLVNLSATTTIESTLVKFTNSSSAKINITGPIDCRTAAYRPAIFTSKDDNSLGESMLGSTGSPTNYYGNGLVISTAGSVLHDLRFSYAASAVTLDFAAGQIQLANVQFVNCQYPIDSSANDDNEIIVDNGLFHQAKYAITGGHNLTVRGRHLTAHQCEQFAHSSSGGGSYAYLTNCLLVGVTNWGSDFTFTTNSTAHFATDTGGIFQTVGAGSHYLADGSTNRNTGTTNVTASLLVALAKKTSYPPIVLSNVTVSVSTNLAPQAQRDSDTPDRGYHYDPIDWLTHWFTVTNNSVLTVTNGATIACYNDTGIWIADGSSIVSIGTPLAPNWFTRASLVQEQAITFGAGAPTSINSFHYADPGPTGVFRFSRFSCPAGDNDNHLFHIDASAEDRFAFDNLSVRDCEFWNGVSYFGGSKSRSGAVIVNNNLFHRSRFWAYNTYATQSLSVSNNLLLGMNLALYGPASDLWKVYDNAFDTCSFFISSHLITNGYNAYINCTNRLSPTNAHDFVLTNVAWQSGFLGDFYQPTNSPLINAGSLTNAGLAGLYHYTSTTNQMKETNSILNIGYHYVAVSNGLPVDADGDSVADYFEDTNGNGIFEAGDFGDWTNFLYANANFPSLNGNTNSNPLPNELWRPDVMGAVGLNHFMSVLNGGVAVCEKSNGSQVAFAKLEDFLRVTVTNALFAGTYPKTNELAGDPRVLYDHVSGRWFACALNANERHTLLAVSKTSDPVGSAGATWVSDNWNHYFIPTGWQPTTNFMDQPSLAVDGNGVYIAVYAIISAPAPGTANAKLRIAALPKSLLIDSTNIVQTNFIFDYPTNTTVYATNSYPYAKPAINFDPVTTNDPVWFVAANFAGDTNLYYNQLKWTNGLASAPVFIMTNWAQLSVTQSFSRLSGYDLPPPHLNTDGFVETRPQMAMVRNLNGTQFLWTCQHIGVNRYGTNGTGSLSADRTAIEWFKIQTTGPVSIADSGRIFDNSVTNPKFYCFPSMAVNKNGDFVVGFSGASAGASISDLVGAYYWGKLSNGASSTAPVCYFSARASTNSQTAIKGGDYSATTLDPVDGLTIWTIQEYAETNYAGYIYGTAVGRVSPY
jgi:hypothetical protein